jgi:hypothetical protein
MTRHLMTLPTISKLPCRRARGIAVEKTIRYRIIDIPLRLSVALKNIMQLDGVASRALGVLTLSMIGMGYGTTAAMAQSPTLRADSQPRRAPFNDDEPASSNPTNADWTTDIAVKKRDNPTRVRKFEEPQTRFVQRARASIHCGPGLKYYPTQLVNYGDALDVYLETADGWSAVRPPEGSYSWIAAEDGFLLPGGKELEVVNAEVPSWIGSRMGTPKKYNWQLKLQPTQVLAVLGESNQSLDGGEDRLWFKVAPPQGEFRWIHTAMLAEQPPRPRATPIQGSRDSSTSLASSSKRNGSGRVRTASTSSNRSTVSGSEVQTAAYQTESGNAEELPQPMPIAQGEGQRGSRDNPLNYEPSLDDVQYDLDDGEFIVGQPTLDGGGYFEGDSNIVYDDAGYSTTMDEYSGEYYEGDYYEGDYYGENYYGDEMIDGQFVDGHTYYDGDVIYDGVSMAPGGLRPIVSGRQSHSGHSHPDGVPLGYPHRPAARQPINDPVQSRFRNFSALSSEGGGMRVRPLGSILGMIGLAVREVEVVQPNALRDPTALAYAESTGSVAGIDRLDRLPRPTRRGASLLSSADTGDSLSATAGRIGDNVRSILTNVNNAGLGGASPSPILNDGLPAPNADGLSSKIAPRSFGTNGSSSIGTGNASSSTIGNGVLEGPRSLGSYITANNGSSSSGSSSSQWHARIDSEQIQNAERSGSPGQFISTGNSSSMGGSNANAPQNATQKGNGPGRPVSTITPSGSARQNSLTEPLTLSTPALREGYAVLMEMIDRPAVTWNFGVLAGFANEWVADGSTALVRGEARLLLEKIQQLEQLRLLAAQTGSSAADLAMNGGGFNGNVSLASASFENQANRSVAATTNESIASYNATESDASGWLRPVYGSNPAQPSYALTDSTGGVLTYVSPAAGMNLGRYEDQPVAIYGSRGVLPELASRHIVAERVVRITR